MGTNKWPAVRDATTIHDVKGTLFYIPLDPSIGQPLRIKEFKLEVATIYVYDMFIGAWGMFPHHDHVPIYFSKLIYAYFFFDMHLDYTSTPSTFYGVGGGCGHARPGARRDPRAQLEIEPLVGHRIRTVLMIDDVAESSQLLVEGHIALVEVTRMTMHGTMMVVQVDRRRAPTAPTEPELQWVADDILCIFYHDTLL